MANSLLYSGSFGLGRFKSQLAETQETITYPSEIPESKLLGGSVGFFCLVGFVLIDWVFLMATLC